MAATYSMGPRLAARDVVLRRWGPWQDAKGLLSQVEGVSGGTVALWGDVRSGGLGALAVGAAAVRADLDTPDGASLALTLVACRRLPGPSAAALFGEDAFGRRIWFYHHIREDLPAVVRTFWDAHERVIRLGLCRSGAFEHRLAQVARVWRLGSGARRRRIQARAVGWALGPAAKVPPHALQNDSVWLHALRHACPPGLTAEHHAAAQRPDCLQGFGPADVVWLGDQLDVDPDPGWAALAPVAVGWSASGGLPRLPGGWTAETVAVANDSPLATHCFVARRSGAGGKHGG